MQNDFLPFVPCMFENVDVTNNQVAIILVSFSFYYFAIIILADKAPDQYCSANLLLQSKSQRLYFITIGPKNCPDSVNIFHFRLS